MDPDQPGDSGVIAGKERRCEPQHGGGLEQSLLYGYIGMAFDAVGG